LAKIFHSRLSILIHVTSENIEEKIKPVMFYCYQSGEICLLLRREKDFRDVETFRMSESRLEADSFEEFK